MTPIVHLKTKTRSSIWYIWEKIKRIKDLNFHFLGFLSVPLRRPIQNFHSCLVCKDYRRVLPWWLITLRTCGCACGPSAIIDLCSFVLKNKTFHKISDNFLPFVGLWHLTCLSSSSSISKRDPAKIASGKSCWRLNGRFQKKSWSCQPLAGWRLRLRRL